MKLKLLLPLVLVIAVVASGSALIAVMRHPVMQWGIFIGHDSSDLASIESMAGKQADMVATFVGWPASTRDLESSRGGPDPFPSILASSLCARDQTMVMFWENYGHSLDGIIAGDDDTYIRAFAQDAAKSTCPVVISLFHEMNGNWDSWDGTVDNNSPAKIIAAYRHVHDLFDGAPQVRWAWVVNSNSVPDIAGNQFADYYPGDAYVDYIGVDGFNFGAPWQSFAQIFDGAIETLQTYHKPIYIFSTASAAGAQKAQWIKDGLGTHIHTYKNVKGWVWFNEKSETIDWRIDADPASLAAFKSVVP